MRDTEAVSEQVGPRRPIAPRLAEVHSIVKSPPPETVLIPPEDNPLRGWRGVSGFFLSDEAWLQGIEKNAVACYLTGRRRGGSGELAMGGLPFVVVLGFFLWVAATVQLTSPEVWWLTILAGLLMAPMSMVMGALMMGWGLRRHLRGMAVEELLVSRLKPVDIVRGLALRPLCRAVAIVLACSLLVPLIGLVAAGHSSIPLTWQWGSLAVAGWAVTILGGMTAAQIGGALALRAHVYVRHPMMAQMRTLLDMVGLAGRFGVVLLIGAWLGGILWFLGMLVSGGASAPIYGGSFNAAGSWVLGPVLAIVGGTIGLALLALIVYTLYWAFTTLAGAINDSAEFTYLYPEAWWITTPGNGPSEDLFGLFTPWLPPESDRMKTFRSRVFGTKTKGYDE